MGTNTHPVQCVSMEGRQHPQWGAGVDGWDLELFLVAATSCCCVLCDRDLGCEWVHWGLQL